MKKAVSNGIRIETLESRTLMSASGVGHHGADFGRSGHGGEGLGGLGGGNLHVPPTTSAAVQADLTTIQTDRQKLNTDLHALSTTDRAKLEADEQAVRNAIRALHGSATLAPLEQKLTTDSQTWNTTLRTDRQAIYTDRNNATKLAADRTKLTTDRAAAETALTADRTAIQTAIDNDPTVKAARKKLATDFPTIAADQAKLQADYVQLQKDIAAQNTTGTGSTTSTT